jgi:hypothetical protein
MYDRIEFRGGIYPTNQLIIMGYCGLAKETAKN